MPSEVAEEVLPFWEDYIYAYDKEGFTTMARECGIEVKSLRENKQDSIREAKIFFGSVIGGIGLVAFVLMQIFFFIDLSTYFYENRNEFVVYRALGINRSKLINGSLLGVLIGTLPSLAVGCLAGEVLTLFLCRNNLAALYFIPGILTFMIGTLVTILLVAGVSYLYLWPELAPSAAEFKRRNKRSDS